MATTNKHWLSDLLKNKFVKVPLIAIVWALSIFTLFIVGKALFGYHVNVFGIEVNAPEPKKDTAIATKYSEPKLSDSINETKNPEILKVKQDIPPIKINPVVITNNTKDTSAKIISTVSGNDNNVNNGVNNGIIGDMFINKEIRLNDQTKLGLLNHINTITDTFSIKPKCFFIALNGNSKETKMLYDIKDYLTSIGYNCMGITAVFVKPFKGIDITINKEKCLSILIGNL